MVEVAKEFEMYRKLEVALFRYYKIAEFLEMCLKFNIKTQDPLNVILSSEGYDNSSSRITKGEFFNESIYIPFNPFYLNHEEKRIWRQIYPNDFSGIENTKESIKKYHQEAWKRIIEIKWWIGAREDTRFCGIKKESRLTTVLENYLRTGIKEFRYDFEHAVFRNVDKETIKKFVNIVKDKRKHIKIVWLLK